jgi:hypothetical protein
MQTLSIPKNLSLLEVRHIDAKFPKNAEKVKGIIDGIRELAKRADAKQNDAAPSNIGDSKWLQSVTGFSIQTISNLCRDKRNPVPGAFRAGQGRGSGWKFRKNLTLSWIESGCPTKG